MSELDDERATAFDGNVAMGLLGELFSFEPSRAAVVCSGCDAIAPIGRLLAYGLDMGAVLRCPHCDTALICIGVTGTRRSLSMRGAAVLRIEVAS